MSVSALKCFAGDPAYQYECTSLSYCLLITSRQGRSQWSCDGNSFNQVSLCSQLGQSGERPLSEREYTDSSSSAHSNERVAVFENRVVGPKSSSELGRRRVDAGEEVDGEEDEELADFYRRQEALLRRRDELAPGDESGDRDNRRRFADSAASTKPVRSHMRPRSAVEGSPHHYGPIIERERDYPSAHERPLPAVHYYSGQLRCFDGGALGRICCCSADFCNHGVMAGCSRWVVMVAVGVGLAVHVYLSGAWFHIYR